ncbi:MAG TPA: HupE/UreJ family protein [Polyangiaceae bacterium]|nr:HupE/UreJ family protein [Polyangiaceae bacterium]
MTRALLCLALVISSLAISHSAHAHAVGISRGEYHRTEAGLAVELSFARAEMAALLQGELGRSDDLSRARGAIERALVPRIQVSSGQRGCSGALADVRALDGDGIGISLRYLCADARAKVHVRLHVLDELAHGHRHAARIVSGGFTEEGLYFKARTELDVPGFRVQGASGNAGHAPASIAGFFRLGIEHILTGYDHVLFLFALLIVGGRLRARFALVSAFTVAHSLTLALTAAGVVAPDPGLVEPAIALSVAYVGLENFWLHDGERRWRIAFLFGLLHGFGFAGALGEISIPREQLLPALIGFNLGVEFGQLVLIAATLPLLARLHRRAWFSARVVPVLSSLVIALGLGWFVQRVHGELLPSAAEVTRSVTRLG